MNESLMNATIALAARCADRDSLPTSQEARLMAQELALMYSLGSCEQEVLFDAAESFSAPSQVSHEELAHGASVAVERAIEQDVTSNALPVQWRQAMRTVSLPSRSSRARLSEVAAVDVAYPPFRSSKWRALTAVAASVGVGAIVFLAVITGTRLLSPGLRSDEETSYSALGSEQEVVISTVPSYEVVAVGAGSDVDAANAVSRWRTVSRGGTDLPSEGNPQVVRSTSPRVARPSELSAGAATYSRDLRGTSTGDASSPALGRHSAPRSAQKGRTPGTVKPATAPSLASGNPAAPESWASSQVASPTPGKPADASITALQLSCTVSEKGAGPGEKFQVQCDATNANESATVITSVEVAVGTYRAKTAVGPAWPEIPAHGSLPFSVTPTLPRDVLPGSSVSVMLTVNTRDSAPVQQQVQVRIH